MRLALPFVLLAVPAMAAEWNIRPWDTVLTSPQIKERVVGTPISFPDGAVARFEPDGSYSYTYRGGNRFDGTWEQGADGALCTTFENGASRCDLFVMQGETLMLINEQGGRFLTAR